VHRTTIWRRKQRQDFSLDSELLELKRPREPKDWRRVTLRDGSKRYIPKVFLIGRPGRREKSEVRERETLKQVAKWIVERRLERDNSEDFDWDAETKHCREKLAGLGYPADMLAVAAVFALRTYTLPGMRVTRRSMPGVRIERRMVRHWKTRKDFGDAFERICVLAYRK
jgi:hypothetical protein